MKLVKGEIVDENKIEEFRFSLDVFNDHEKWRSADEHFEYIGNFVGGRIWKYTGTLNDFKKELNKFDLHVEEGGYRSESRWYDGDWIYCSVRCN